MVSIQQMHVQQHLRLMGKGSIHSDSACLCSHGSSCSCLVASSTFFDTAEPVNAACRVDLQQRLVSRCTPHVDRQQLLQHCCCVNLSKHQNMLSIVFYLQKCGLHLGEETQRQTEHSKEKDRCRKIDAVAKQNEQINAPAVLPGMW